MENRYIDGVVRLGLPTEVIQYAARYIDEPALFLLNKGQFSNDPHWYDASIADEQIWGRVVPAVGVVKVGSFPWGQPVEPF